MDHRNFAKRLNSAKSLLEERHAIQRYPFNTFDNLALIDKLFASHHLTFSEAAASGTILDVGCGDGDLGLFMSSQGYAVEMIDYEETNQNRMRMVRSLSEQLAGKQRVFSFDLDRGLHSLENSYSCAFVFGLLYHLKNPFLLMSDLATIANFALLSTRIVDSALLPDREASAYLVADRELGEDNTNFWLFNSKGLSRLAERSGWTIVSSSRFGDLKSGDATGHDAREALLLASDFSVFDRLRLTYGLNRVEYGSYRWTQKRFGIQARPLETHRVLRIRYFVPRPWNAPVKLRFFESGRELQAEQTVGTDECLASIALEGPPHIVNLDVRCEHSFEAAADRRDLGVVLRLDRKQAPLWLEP